MRRRIKTAINSLLSPAGIELIRRGSANPHVRGYLPARMIVKAAAKRGLDLCDYLETILGEPGNTQAVIEHMRELNVFDGRLSVICEIGAGSGRFLERTIAKCKPVQYECYEPDPAWREYLQSQYGAVCQPTDGYSLKHTLSASVDLVHAHGVFVYLPFLTTFSYLREMARVASQRGRIVFDILSEDCLNEAAVNEWLRSKQMYPCVLPRQYVLQLFESWGFTLHGEFMSRLGVGTSHYMVFERGNGI